MYITTKYDTHDTHRRYAYVIYKFRHPYRLGTKIVNRYRKKAWAATALCPTRESMEETLVEWQATGGEIIVVKITDEMVAG